MREIKKIVIAGAGTMGASMGQTFAINKCRVFLAARLSRLDA